MMNKAIFLIVLAIMLARAASAMEVSSPTPCLPSGQIVNLLVTLDFTPKADEEGSTRVPYRLFEPAGRSADRKFPLIVWLHDHGPVENDPSQGNGFLNHLGALLTESDRRKFPFYLLAMKCPTEASSWLEGEGEHSPIALLQGLLAESLDRFPIDPQRVYLVGFGTGTAGCWELASRQPERYAALLLFSPNKCDPSLASELAQIPTWILTRQTGEQNDSLTALTGAGGIVAQTVVSSDGNCWESAFAEYDLAAWLLAQKQGGFCWQRPGQRPWQVQSLLSRYALPLLVVVGLAWAWRRRRKIARTKVITEHS